MSLKYVPRAPPLITSIGVLSGLNSIHNGSLSSNFELFKRLKDSS